MKTKAYKILFYFLSSHLILSTANAEKTASLPFFRHPQSAFPSGEASPRDLEKNWVKDEAQMSYEILRGKQKIWIKANEIARDINLSLLATNGNNSIKYKILKIDGRQVLAQNPQTLQAEWMAIESLASLPEDLGIATNLIAATLHAKPEWKSIGVHAAEPLTRLQVKNYQDNWVQVSPINRPEVTGWVDNSNLLFKHDFASEIKTSDTSGDNADKWIPVLYRHGTMMVGYKQQQIPMSKVIALKTKNSMGISLVSHSDFSLLMKQNVSISKTDYDVWSTSKLPGHGIIYWKKSEPTQNKNQNTDQINDQKKSVPTNEPPSANNVILKTEDLLKREVVSISFNPKKTTHGLASAEGIYLTTDGKNWRRLNQFGNKNAPVLIDESDTLYVGSENSNDLGEHFSAYLKWDELAHMVEKKQNSPARELKIRNIKNPRPGILSIEFDTGSDVIRMAARKTTDSNLKWDFE